MIRNINIIFGVIGLFASGVFYYATKRILNQLQKISNQIDVLNDEMSKIKNMKPENSNKKSNQILVSRPNICENFNSDFNILSDDDEDEFVEAYGFLPWLNRMQTQHEDLQTITSSRFNNLSFLQDIDRLLDGDDEQKKQAHIMLSTFSDKENCEILWRLAKSTFFQSQLPLYSQDLQDKKKLIYEAKELASKALEIQDDNPNVHKWFALTLGSTNDYEPIKTKILNGFTFKKHIEKAISLNPNDPTNYYLLGRWCYGVYMMSWIERNVAATLFSTPPTSTIQEALSNFLKADKLKPSGWKENLLFVGKCYIELKDYSSAIIYLLKANCLPNLASDDYKSQVEISYLVNKYKSYAIS